MHLRIGSFCLSMLALTLSSSRVVAVEILPTASGDFDYFMLSHEWPYSFCETLQCRNTNKLQPLFNIHGLWPENPKGSCEGQFNVSELLPIKAQLEAAWMDLKDPNNEPTEFWTHEYTKHGTCASSDSRYSTTFLYFNAALQLHNNYTLTAMLSQAGIVPGPDPIKASTIRDAVVNSFSYEPQLSCVTVKGVTYLFELRLCFEKDLSGRNCPVSKQPSRSSSGGALKYIEMRPELLTDSDELGDQRPQLRTEICSMDADVLMPNTLGP